MEPTPGRTPLFSSTLSAVIRYIGASGFSREQVELLCKRKKMHPEECTIRNNIHAGIKRMEKYPPAVLSDSEKAEIEDAVGKPSAERATSATEAPSDKPKKEKKEKPHREPSEKTERAKSNPPSADVASDGETIGNWSLVEYAGHWEVRNIHNGREHVVECKTEKLARQSIASMIALHEELLEGEGPSAGHYKLVQSGEGGSWFALHKAKSTRSRLYATEQLATKYAELATEFEDGKMDKQAFLKALAELDSAQRDKKNKIG